MPATPSGSAAQGAVTGAATGGATGGATAAKSETSNADRRFVNEAAAAGMADVAAGQLASQKSQNPQVRAFAQKMVEDHTKANAELMKLASARDIKPPARPDRGHKNAMEKLQKLEGDAFDRQYMKQQVDDHEKAVKLYERQSRSGRDAELKALAEKALPTLREHLKMAQSDSQAASSRGPSGASRTGAAASGGGTMSGSAGATPGSSGTSGPAGSPGTGSTAGSTQPGGAPTR